MLIEKIVLAKGGILPLAELGPGKIFVFQDTPNIGDALLSKPGETPGIWRVVMRGKWDPSKGVDIISIDGKGGLNSRQGGRPVVELSADQCSLELPPHVDPAVLGDLAAGDIFYQHEDLWQVVEAGPKVAGKISALCLKGARYGEISGEWDADRVLGAARGNSVKLRLHLRFDD